MPGRASGVSQGRLERVLTAAARPLVTSAWNVRFNVSSVSVGLSQLGLVGLVPSYSSMANSAV